MRDLIDFLFKEKIVLFTRGNMTVSSQFVQRWDYFVDSTHFVPGVLLLAAVSAELSVKLTTIFQAKIFNFLIIVGLSHDADTWFNLSRILWQLIKYVSLGKHLLVFLIDMVRIDWLSFIILYFWKWYALIYACE